MSRVLLGMSGGIDSTVSALLLLEQGHEVVGVTFRTYDSIKESCIAREKGCCTIDSIMEAKHNAAKMGFEHHIVDFRDTFRRCVIDNFIDEYMHGRTPNPCVLCNSHIKWGEMLRLADEMGCDHIATGHYARIREHRGHTFLAKAADVRKDQTYFLWMLTEANLRRTIFPLGDLTKDQVRAIAADHGYTKLVQKKESQDICFLPDNDYRAFLREGRAVGPASQDQRSTSGTFIDKEGRILGKHDGFHNFTIGQRKHLGIALGFPAYVTAINAETNQVTLGTYDDLYANQLTISHVRLRDPEWLQEDPTVQARIRYNAPAAPATIVQSSPNSLNPVARSAGEVSNYLLHFSQPVWGVTPGQSAVLYKDDLVLGGGLIE